MIHDGLVDRFFKVLGPQHTGVLQLPLHRHFSCFEVLIGDFENVREHANITIADNGGAKGNLGRESSLGEETDRREGDRKEAWLQHGEFSVISAYHTPKVYEK